MKVELNIERQLLSSVRAKVGSNMESVIHFVYMNLPHRICLTCNRLGHVQSNCAILENRMLEGIYDSSPYIDIDDESQSWEDEFKVLLDEEIDLAGFSDETLSSPAFLSPSSVLDDIMDFDFFDADEFLDQLYGPDSDSSAMGEEEGESDGLALPLSGSDSVLVDYPSNLGKRTFSDLSPITPSFSPLPDYNDISDWDFKTRSDGLLGDFVKNSNFCLGESSAADPAITDLTSPHLSDNLFFSPENDFPVKPAFLINFSSSSSEFSSTSDSSESDNLLELPAKPAFIITFSSSSSENSSSNVSSESGFLLASEGPFSDHFNPSPPLPPPPSVLNVEVNPSQNEFNQYGSFLEESAFSLPVSFPIEEQIVSIMKAADEGNQGAHVLFFLNSIFHNPSAMCLILIMCLACCFN